MLKESIPTPVHTFQVDALSVEVYSSAEAVAIAASAKAAKILQTAIEERQQAIAIFATGRSQKQCLHYLTHSQNHRSALDWSKITGFHLDEYLGIAAAHPASFRHYLQTHLTSQVSMQAFYEIEGDGLSPLSVCEQYEEKLRSHLPDLCFLGIGNNGHLAFNDPAVADFNDPRWVKIVRLDEKNRRQQADSTDFETIEAVPNYAFTLTLSAIGAIRHRLCLAFGDGKAAVVKRLLTGPIDPSCPATILRKLPQTTLLIDQAAAADYLSSAFD
ncbi:6-phosphogluconolactonase [cf. Phormidesmis sp. LEGE 11477]|uniref:6-phosphogluconolactonase n=1 Tax=cf. Phormidesmis sp. LEGE 11477 TaxID=1828680 RepID=UPI001881A450|nr:6-phosphogluconolactonase [cf. Phormidesmis sp. LEGE 11477]MBE9063237.1 6-phosphogluconolactonase [cf. Phormidesmis sp. LEGE 11477]